jgi:chromosomal replication initiation ATPase DnaA
MLGLTLEEIANKLGYKTHTGVLKRIRKIGRYYEKFAGVDYGFSEKKII